jgi:hypothetical protein
MKLIPTNLRTKISTMGNKVQPPDHLSSDKLIKEPEPFDDLDMNKLMFGTYSKAHNTNDDEEEIPVEKAPVTTSTDSRDQQRILRPRKHIVYTK